VTPLVVLLGSHQLVQLVTECVAKRTAAAGGKGSPLAIRPDTVRFGAIFGLCLVGLYPTLSRVLQRPWPPRHSLVLQDMAELDERVPSYAVVMSDVPSRVAWYAKRPALLLPPVVGKDPEAAHVADDVAAIYLSPELLRYGPGGKAEAWQRMLAGERRSEGFLPPAILPEGGRLLLRERPAS